MTADNVGPWSAALMIVSDWYRIVALVIAALQNRGMFDAGFGFPCNANGVRLSMTRRLSTVSAPGHISQCHRLAFVPVVDRCLIERHPIDHCATRAP